MTPEQFEEAVLSLKGYFGTYGVFGGCPTLAKNFPEYCRILQKHVPKEQCGLWANTPNGHGKIMRETFNPSRSNLNVHLDKKAYREFRRDWPESIPFGLDKDSRHSPPYVAMQDVLKKPCLTCKGQYPLNQCDVCDGSGYIYDEEKTWELISNCDINQHWSAMICVFRDQLRGYFCEIAGAQAMIHQWRTEECPECGGEGAITELTGPDDNPEMMTCLACEGRGETYIEPDLGVKIEPSWWNQGMDAFADQVDYHCHRCGVPLRGYGELAQTEDQKGKEQVSEIHLPVYQIKRRTRELEVVNNIDQLGSPLQLMTDYLGNSQK